MVFIRATTIANAFAGSEVDREGSPVSPHEIAMTACPHESGEIVTLTVGGGQAGAAMNGQLTGIAFTDAQAKINIFYLTRRNP